jgi:pimeloyl-ACP methyl ester carboxylesterase
MLAHDTTGSGPALALLHGLGGARANWDPVIPALAEHHQVITIDLPGFGGSPALNGGATPTAARMAEAVLESLAELGIGDFHVAGNSLGGWVALETAVQSPRVRSVTGICPAGLWGKPLGPRRGPSSRRLGPFALPVLGMVAAVPPLRNLALSGVLAHPERMGAADALRMMRAYVGSTGFDAADQEMRSAVFDLEQAALEIPVTLLWGEKDRLVRPSRRIPPSVRQAMLSDAGHVPMWDRPDVVAAAILETTGAAAPSPVG